MPVGFSLFQLRACDQARHYRWRGAGMGEDKGIEMMYSGREDPRRIVNLVPGPLYSGSPRSNRSITIIDLEFPGPR